MHTVRWNVAVSLTPTTLRMFPRSQGGQKRGLVSALLRKPYAHILELTAEQVKSSNKMAEDTLNHLVDGSSNGCKR